MSEEQVADVSVESEVAPSVLQTDDSMGDWREALPDDLRDHQALRNISDVSTLAKTMIHAQSMVGAEKIPVPGKWATDDDWSQVYAKLGRPEAAEMYEFETGETELDQDFVNTFREVAHKAGLSNRQAQELAGWYVSLAGEGGPEGTVDVEAAKLEVAAELRKEYGNAFEDRIALGDNYIDEFAAEGLGELRLEDGIPLVNHPAFIRTMINAAQYINESVSEDKLVGDKSSGGITPAEADQQITQLMRPDSPYWDASHPMHESHVQQVYQLQQQKWPEENE